MRNPNERIMLDGIKQHPWFQIQAATVTQVLFLRCKLHFRRSSQHAAHRVAMIWLSTAMTQTHRRPHCFACSKEVDRSLNAPAARMRRVLRKQEPPC